MMETIKLGLRVFGGFAVAFIILLIQAEIDEREEVARCLPDPQGAVTGPIDAPYTRGKMHA